MMNTRIRRQVEPSIATASRPGRRAKARLALSAAVAATAVVLTLTGTAAHASSSGATGYAARAAAQVSLGGSETGCCA